MRERCWKQMNGQAYEQYKASVKQEILEQLDCGRDFSDAEVQRIIDERLCSRECAGRLDVAGRRRLGKSCLHQSGGWMCFRSFWRIRALRRL